MKPDSDYCDQCTTLNNTVSICDEAEEEAVLRRKLRTHREHSRSEFQNYKNLM